MATESRTQDFGLDNLPAGNSAENSSPETSALENALRAAPWSFEFFQAVTLLQRLAPHRQPVGRFSNPDDEAVRFRGNTSLGFPASSIQQLDFPADGDGPPEMMVNFMGLTGPMGVLPYCYSELALERQRAKDTTFQSFLDIFHHRMISFFHRAWEKYRFPVTHATGEGDSFEHHLRDLIGLGTPGLENRQAISDDGLLHFAALLGEQARSASALEQLLASYFDVPVEVEEFTGAWYRLDSATQCSLGDDDSDSQKLGLGAVVGDEIWDQQSRIRIKLGPMALEKYRQFLPDGTAYEPLKALTKFFSNDEFDFEIQLILKSDEVPRCQVGADDATAPRLGWVTWLKSAPLSRDPNETILNL
jgi:type VI secretion system protein ImpH